MQAIILAGGLGSRLQSVLPDLPKPMAPIGGRPFLAVLIDYLEKQGIESVVLSVGYRHQVIVGYFGNRRGAVRIDYVVEKKPLGTGGAIRQSLATVAPGSTLVLNGDTFLRADYRNLLGAHQRGGGKITLGLASVPDISRYGSVVLEGNAIVGFREKQDSGPGLINSGCYVVEHDLFDGFDLPEVFSFERDFLYPWLDRISPRGYIVDGYFIDIGIPEDYHRAVSELS